MLKQGMRVLCVNDEFPPIAYKLCKQLPKLDATYHIRDFAPGIGLDNKEEVLVTLIELRNPPDPYNIYGLEIGFKAERFKPVEGYKFMKEGQTEATAL